MDLQDQISRLADPWNQASSTGFLPLQVSPMRLENRVNDWLWLLPHLV
jgi:hypothetical protein